MATFFAWLFFCRRLGDLKSKNETLQIVFSQREVVKRSVTISRSEKIFLAYLESL